MLIQPSSELRTGDERKNPENLAPLGIEPFKIEFFNNHGNHF